MRPLTATGLRALAVWALLVLATFTMATEGSAAAQTGGCTATGNGTSWVLHEPGPGAPSAGIAVGAPGGADVVDLSVTGWTGRLGTTGLPAGATLEFFASSMYPAGQSFSVNVTTNAAVTSGAFTTYPINSAQSGYLPMVSCPIQAAAPATATTTTTAPLGLTPLVPHSVSSTSDDLAWLWWGLVGLGALVIVTFFAVHTSRNGSFGWLCDDDDDDDDDDRLCGWLGRIFCRDDGDRPDGDRPDGGKPPGLSAADEAAAAAAMDVDEIPIAGDSAPPPDEVM